MADKYWPFPGDTWLSQRAVPPGVPIQRTDRRPVSRGLEHVDRPALGQIDEGWCSLRRPL